MEYLKQWLSRVTLKSITVSEGKTMNWKLSQKKESRMQPLETEVWNICVEEKNKTETKNT
jgi:hypothetical protein